MRTRVAFAACSQYRPADIQNALARLLAELGGLNRFVRPGARVLIKPNLLTDRAPEEAVTTHPEVLRALIRLTRQCGGIVRLGDSPCGVMKIEAVLEKTGLRALCREEDVQFVVFEKEESVICHYQGVPLAIAKPALAADLIINVPKLKTHSFTVFTNAVKNVFGLLPGFQKSLLHRSFPTPAQFGACLAFLYSKVRPGLTVCDAVTAMEGDGPSAGAPVQLNFLAAAADGVALDHACAQLLKIDAQKVDYLRALQRLGIGEADLKNIELAGDYAQVAARPALRQPAAAGIARFIPPRLVRWLAPLLWIRPSFTENCTGCGLCRQACPMQALGAGRHKHPLLNAAQCIGCCCCHEICPQNAIRMVCSPLLSLTAMRRLVQK